MDIDLKLMGKRIAEKRRKKNITQETFSEQLSISMQYLSRIECGRANPTLKNLVKIANGLECTLDELLCDSIVADSAVIMNETSELFEDCSNEEILLLSKWFKSLHGFMRDAQNIVKE
ncbi:MAG: helix-turn-helix transcriptional regulator [Ruminococcus sp.]|nr:helix-turn-helix transcriptional regulator [Ruminococcus sp.]